MAAQNLLNALLSASDALMLGLLDQSSLSAVSLAAQVQFVFSLVMDAAIIGTTILAAQYWGKGDTRAVEKIQANTLRISCVVGAFFCFAALTVPQSLMCLFTPDEELIRLGASYLRIVSVSYLFGVFHHTQHDLGESAEQIGNTDNAQVGSAEVDQLRIRGKQAHQ